MNIREVVSYFIVGLTGIAVIGILVVAFANPPANINAPPPSLKGLGGWEAFTTSWNYYSPVLYHWVLAVIGIAVVETIGVVASEFVNPPKAKALYKHIGAKE